ncbi:MAG: BamA/TamA family outer membrane protein [Gemmatimonadetes bacterium]|nr:BamA/TamA family outer membrane protein [Gemmatimonadota bacterium]
MRLFSLLVAGLMVPAAICAQQDSVPAPADTFADPAVRALMARAVAARNRDIQGIRSYEGRLREHIYVGLTAFRFRRERGLFEQERIARLRWSADGERAIQWIGARQAIPIVGADTRRDEIAARGQVGKAGASVNADLRRELPQELLHEADLPNFAFDPSGDRLAFGGDWALHPLSDSAGSAYRFASGDTLRIGLPGQQRDVVLYEVKVEPRRADFHLVAGSLWFDSETASLVRATYKPARAFDLSIDEPHDAEEVPGFLKPVQGDISYITVEYSLHELRYWLPRRFALEGELRMGRVLKIPLTVEWSIGDYSVNDISSEIPVTGPLPPGWSRSEQKIKDSRGVTRYVTVVVPDDRSVLTSPELSESFGERAPTAFTDDEVAQLKGELQALMPTYRQFRPQFAWGLQRGLVRYNRVEGLSVGGAVTFPLDPLTTLDLEARVGTGSHEPDITATLRRGSDDRSWSLAGYHRLQTMGDWGTPFSITSSLGNLVLGIDRAQYFRATGASVGYRRMGERVRWEAQAFHERQQPVSREATFFLLQSARDDTVDLVLPARDVSVTGARTTVSWFSGIDPHGLIATGQLVAEAAGGDVAYQRAALSLSVSHPLFFGLAGALEAGAGALWGDEPIQENFFLGGSSTLRGFDAYEVHGASFWRARAELATGFAGARLGVFSDAGWVGPKRSFGLQDPMVSVGVGASLLDGLFRIDVSHAVRRGSRYKLNLYLDGLF